MRAVATPTILLAYFIEFCVSLETCDSSHQPKTGPRSGPRALKVLQPVVVPVQLYRVSCQSHHHQKPPRTEEHIGNGTAECHSDVLWNQQSDRAGCHCRKGGGGTEEQSGVQLRQ
jgi:hypothetical protein